MSRQATSRSWAGYRRTSATGYVFANAQWLVDQLTLLVAQEQPQALVLDYAVIPDFEYTALNTLSEFKAQFREGSITFGMAQLNPTALGMVERSSLGKTLG